MVYNGFSKGVLGSFSHLVVSGVRCKWQTVLPSVQGRRP